MRYLRLVLIFTFFAQPAVATEPQKTRKQLLEVREAMGQCERSEVSDLIDRMSVEVDEGWFGIQVHYRQKRLDDHLWHLEVRDNGTSAATTASRFW